MKYSSVYTANGGEKFITLGRFAYERDRDIIRQFKSLRHRPWKDRILRFVKSDRSLVCKRFFDRREEFDIGEHNYYYIDIVEVIPLDSIGKYETKEPPEKGIVHNHTNNGLACDGCIDLDADSPYPSFLDFEIDPGFVNDMTVQLNISLQPMEKFRLTYGRNSEVVFLNMSDKPADKLEVQYVFDYPARRLRRNPLRVEISVIESDFPGGEFKMVDTNGNIERLGNAHFLLTNQTRRVRNESLEIVSNPFPASNITLRGPFRDWGGFMMWGGD